MMSTASPLAITSLLNQRLGSYPGGGNAVTNGHLRITPKGSEYLDRIVAGETPAT